MKKNTGKAPVIPVLLLSFCLAFSLVFSSYDKIIGVDIISPYISFESQDLSGWNGAEKAEGGLSFFAIFLMAIVFFTQRSPSVFPASPCEKTSRRLRC